MGAVYMTSSIPKIKIHTPLVGDVNNKSRITYQASRTAITGFNGIVMAAAEAYINGLKIPDPLLKILLNLSIQISYKYFPSLLVPYEWLLQESDRLAEGSHELMKVQYNLPEEMFSLILKETELLYPKYSMALWEKGASNLEQAQMDMLDDLIAKAGIEDGDEILDLGCGWGSASNYILSRFPRVKVTAVNLSHQQCEYMRRKMQDPNSYLIPILYEDAQNKTLETPAGQGNYSMQPHINLVLVQIDSLYMKRTLMILIWRLSLIKL